MHTVGYIAFQHRQGQPDASDVTWHSGVPPSGVTKFTKLPHSGFQFLFLDCTPSTFPSSSVQSPAFSIHQVDPQVKWYVPLTRVMVKREADDIE